MTPLAKKIAGLHIQDSPAVDSPVLYWLQSECRIGSLRPSLDEFVRDQDEPLDPSLAVVESVSKDVITATLPCKMVDHESCRPFRVDVSVSIDPRSGVVSRNQP